MSGALLIVLVGLLMADAGLAQQDPVIYRCEKAGVIEFSDRPCADETASGAEGADTFDPSGGSVSVISPPDDLDTIQEANRTWLQDYRARQAAEAASRIDSRRNRAAQAGRAVEPVEGRTIVQPILWPYRPPRYFHRSPHRPGHAASITREQPYSALSGPFPGTRRSDPEPAAPPDR